MELVKDVLKVEEQKGYEEIETLVETELYLNQTTPEIENILWTDGKIEILSTKIVQDKILVNGLVKFKLVYRSKEEEGLNINSVETNVDFKEEIYIDGITEQMAVQVKPGLEYIEYDLVDERKVVLRALVNLLGRVEETNSLEIIKEVNDKPDLQLLKEKIKYNDVLSRDETYALIKEAFEVDENQPAIEKVLKVDIHAYEKEINISYDRIILAGVLECYVIYFGGGKLNSLKREIPFTHFIDVENAEHDSKCQLSMELISGEYEIRENLEGENKILDLEAKIKVNSKLFNQREKEVIIDAYSTEEKIRLETREIRVMENIKSIISREEVIKDITNSEFKEIYAVEGYAKVLDSQYVEDKIVIDGIITLNIYYQESIKDEITTLKEEVPFKFYLTAEDLGENLKIETISNLESIKYHLKDNTLSIDAAIKNHVFVNRERKIKILSNLEETGELIDKKSMPSIIVYMVQKDDILWDIAKRYNTTVEEIIESNNILSPSNLMPGEKIIIEKKVDVNL